MKERNKNILVLLESPGKIKKVSEILNNLKDGNNYIVMASMGHITRIEDSGTYKMGIDLKTFEETFEILPDKKQIVKTLKEAVKNADEVFLASDSDREGDVISYAWITQLKIPKTKYKRLIFHEITETGIKEGIKNAGKINENSIEAGRTRAVLDKLTGYRLSPFVRNAGGKSAGRVQSAVLKILREKEEEIKKFKSKDYYEIILPFLKEKRKLTAQFKGTENKKIISFSTKEEADEILKNCEKGKFEVKTITSKERNLNPKDVFTTSTFQQEVSSNLGYNPKKAMMVAQKLYEKGFVTYMRTDSTRISEEFIKETKIKIEKEYGKNYYKGYTSSKTKENAQDGHEGLRPTHLSDTPEKIISSLETDEFKVYKLIYKRALASLMSSAKIKDTEVGIFNKENKFSISGQEIIFDGFLKVYKDEKENEEILPTFKIGEKIKDSPLEIIKKTTQPPNRYSESGIIKKMEEVGIGRPSTFAPTLEILKTRDYIEIKKKAIFVTDLGIKVSLLLKKYFLDIINTEYTAQMESTLDEIAKGNLKRTEELKKFYEPFSKKVLEGNKEVNKLKEAPKDTGKICPKCGGKLLEKISKFGKFYACNHYPKCKYTETLEGKEKKVEKSIITDIVCPKCKKGKLVKRISKKEEVFYGCTEFFKGCKFTMKENDFNLNFLNKGFSDISNDKE